MSFKLNQKVVAILRGAQWEDAAIVEVRPGGIYVASNGRDTRIFDAWNRDYIRAKYRR